ncbi:unnamed protein product [Diabrotica balteata]|uniref:Saposin B-type domain-containing protein n=1 Tax=Diabrotica balteata TaxID=107213 RepID=A0A9P0DTT8_DIABA|nr:unnamed protein product [Diabrotica balteata]
MKTILILALFSCIALTVYAKESDHEPTREPTREPEPEPDNEFECDACITFATVIKDYVEEKIPLDEIERDADRLCNVLPNELREFCDHELLPKVDKIFEELLKHSPDDVCEHLHFCGK